VERILQISNPWGKIDDLLSQGLENKILASNSEPLHLEFEAEILAVISCDKISSNFYPGFKIPQIRSTLISTAQKNSIHKPEFLLTFSKASYLLFLWFFAGAHINSLFFFGFIMFHFTFFDLI
jgi:hypothetical protein